MHVCACATAAEVVTTTAVAPTTAAVQTTAAPGTLVCCTATFTIPPFWQLVCGNQR